MLARSCRWTALAADLDRFRAESAAAATAATAATAAAAAAATASAAAMTGAPSPIDAAAGGPDVAATAAAAAGAARRASDAASAFRAEDARAAKLEMERFLSVTDILRFPTPGMAAGRCVSLLA